jgi:hypothetical protein
VNSILARATLAGLLVAVVTLIAGFNWWQRFQSGEIDAYVANRTDMTLTVRASDGSTDRILTTVRLDPQTRTLVVRHRLDLWWRDLTAQEQEAGRVDNVRLELLGDACVRLAEGLVHHSEAFTILPDDVQFTYYQSDAPLPVLAERSGSSIEVPDPCHGRSAPAIGLLANQTKVPVAIADRIVVPACSSVVVHPGDLAAELPAKTLHDVARVPATSLAIQRGRWPMEPRSIVVTREDVFDESGSAGVDPDFYGDCAGLPLADHDEADP